MKKNAMNAGKYISVLPRQLKSFGAVLLICCCPWGTRAQQVTTINATGTGTFNVPAGTDSIVVECWGGGGSGGGTATGHGAGGGGGAYAAKTFSSYYGNALPDGAISYSIAALPSSSTGTGGNGGPATFGNSGNILLSANGGNGGGGTSSSGGNGGSATTSDGIISFAGGKGAAGGSGDGGAGGGSGGAGGAGGNASGTTPGAAGAGINGQSTGAAGAAGLTITSNGTAGTQPGSGGSGGRRKSGATVQGGAGGAGRIIITVYSTPLAIRLGRFSVAAIGSENHLEWNTASEAAGDLFRIQRSSDGRQFGQLAEITGHGAKEGSSYSYTDAKPPEGSSFYRLLMVNKDGTRYYSKIVTADSRERNSGLIRAYPNPVKAALMVHINTAAIRHQDCKLTLTDANGKVIRTIRPGLSDTAVFHMNGLPEGVYFVTLRAGKITRSVRVVK